MISYCVAVYRPVYASLLLADLAAKTTAPYEILLWLNTECESLEGQVASMAAEGVPLHIVGRTPENIGMAAYQRLFAAARYPLIAQIDDDSIFPSSATRGATSPSKEMRHRPVIGGRWQRRPQVGSR